MVLGDIFAAVAAVAAVIAVKYARETVTEAERANEASAEANQAAAEAHVKQLAAMQTASEATIAATEAAAEQHKMTLAAELSIRRMEQLERVSDLLLRIANVAHAEVRNPPDKLSAGITGSRLPVLHRHFGNSFRIEELITGVSELPRTAELARAGWTGAAMNSLGGATDALSEIEKLLLDDDEMDAVRFQLE